VQIDWIHQPAEGPGTLNLCFNALDRHVIRGRADEPAIAAEGPTSYARLLEEVAAFGGVLRAFGIGLGDTVVARLPPGKDALVALLASTRVGAVHVLEEPAGDEEAVVVPGGVIRRGGASSPDDLDWDVVLRAGRTDPAPCAEVPASAPALVADGRTLSTTEVLERSTGWPYDALATLLGGGAVELGA
jgi:hypothetical protein